MSIVFAFVFTPVGAVLGQLALSQIKAATQQGRNRALVGLTLSYVFISFAIVGLFANLGDPKRLRRLALLEPPISTLRLTGAQP